MEERRGQEDSVRGGRREEGVKESGYEGWEGWCSI